MPSRLIVALALSLVLHGGLLFSGIRGHASPSSRPPLLASLRPPPEPAPGEILPPAIDPLLKNTIDDEVTEKAAPRPRPAPARGETKVPGKTAFGKQEMQAVQKKLSKYVFYPEEARRLGIEGTVVLFVELSRNGQVEDVRLVASSGFPILDNAAIKGFYAVGRLPGKSDAWSYTFQLQ